MQVYPSTLGFYSFIIPLQNLMVAGWSRIIYLFLNQILMEERGPKIGAFLYVLWCLLVPLCTVSSGTSLKVSPTHGISLPWYLPCLLMLCSSSINHFIPIHLISCVLPGLLCYGFDLCLLFSRPHWLYFNLIQCPPSFLVYGYKPLSQC